MNHRYLDTSKLNAEFDLPPPPHYASLGSVHQYDDYSNLNAMWDDIPLQGLGGGVLASPGGIGVLGLGVVYDFPADATKAAQSEYNTWAKTRGYCPIAVDGKMGPGTCGALRRFANESGYGGASMIGGGYPSVCQSFTEPSAEPCSKGVPAPAKPPPVTPLTPETATTSAMSARGSSGTTWIILGGLVAAGAVGAALYYKKKKGR